MNAVVKKVEAILKSPYATKNYVDLIREIFPKISMVSPDKFRKEFTNFSSHIEGSIHVGNYKTPDKKNIIIMAVQLKNAGYVENSRSTQRSYAKKLIENANADAAFIAFYTEGEPKWRLSFVRLDYEMKIENGRLKTTENLTPAKRYSYLVGENEPCHTAISRFERFIIDSMADPERPTLDDLENAFSVEKVTDEFFKLYCEKFHQLREKLEENEDFRIEAEQHNFTSAQFAKKLMGQIVFLYFLQKKGWLGVGAWPNTLTEKEYKNAYYARGAKSRELIPIVYRPVGDGTYRISGAGLNTISDEDEAVLAMCVKGKPWGSGPHNFMRKLFEIAEKKNQNFFDELLEPLFYDALNVNRGEQGYCPALHCRIPFLSGGLFEPIDGYDWEHNNFNIPNEVFSNAVTKGREADGILDIFDRYNFTMSEDEPMEREVAIDPEMLGKVFENLLEVNDRKSKGAFYTPREIVHYMCQESLINYLTNTLQIEEEAIREFILYGDFMKDEDTVKEKRQGNGGMYISESLFKLDADGKVVVDRLKDVDEALKNVRVADPAVGSGAFPLGMLNEIVRARQNISAYMAITMNAYDTRLMYQMERSPHNLKYETIKNCIFAADIEPSAVDIAQLRLWLSLVIDDEINPNAQSALDGHKNPLPLPNLESNILCGNSLIDEFEGTRLVKESELFGDSTYQLDMNHSRFESIVSALIDKQNELFHCDNTEKKKQLKEEIESLRDMVILSQLEGCSSDKIQKYHESKRMASKPYVLWQLDFARVFREKGGFDIVIGNPPYGAKLSVAEKALYKKKYNDVHMRTPDTYNYFISMSSRIVHSEGVLSFIVPNTLLFQNEYEKARIFLTDSNMLKFVVNIGDNVFEKADVPTCIFLIQKTVRKSYNIQYADYRETQNKDIIWGSYTEKIPYDVLIETPGRVLGVNSKDSNILKKVQELSISIDSIAEEVAAGISSGGNDVFCISRKFADENNFEDELLKPLLTGKIIDRYSNSWNGELIIYSTKWSDTPKYKNIYEHLLPHEERLSKKREAQKGLIPWYSLHWPRNPELFCGTKIVMRQTSDCIRATLDNEDYYALNTLLVLKLKDNVPFSYEFVLAVLNSTLNNYIYRSLTQEKGRTFAEVKPKNVRKLLIPKIGKSEQDRYVKIVQEMLNGNCDIEVGMRQIDEMLYSLYGFDKSEISTIEEQ